MLFLTEVTNKEVAHKKPKQLFQIESINIIKSDPAGGLGPSRDDTVGTFRPEVHGAIAGNPCPHLPSNEVLIKKQLTKLVQRLQLTTSLLEHYDGDIKKLRWQNRVCGY